MSTTLATRAILIERTLRFYAELTEQHEDYLEECEYYREQGYRPHYCEHGTNLWVDYDNICGPCEDGFHLRSLDHRWERAVLMAEGRHGRY